jgi:hypothetical protein
MQLGNIGGSTMIPKTNDDRMRAVTGGAVAGLASGLVLTLMMTVMAASHHKDVWYGMKGAAAPFLGHRAMHAGFDLGAVVLGLSTHFLISIGWGVLFAFFFYGSSRLKTMLGGIAYGLVVWIGMYYVVLPIVGLGAMTREAPIGRVIMFHEMFSIVLAGAFLGWQRIQSRIWRPLHAFA